MSRSFFEVLCRYFYDPLDRLMRAGPSQRFYQQDQLVTELDDQEQRSILRHGAQPLAQQDASGETRLLATDRAHSPLLALSETLLQHIRYSSYGHAPAESGLSRLLGFNGECPERVTGHYLLGQGNRAFNPMLMRFNSPDELSPFGGGGINSYAYCEGDPVNFSDPTGNVKFANKTGLPFTRARPPRPVSSTIAASITRAKPTSKNPILNRLLDAPAQPSSSRTQSVSTLPPTNTELKLVPKLKVTDVFGARIDKHRPQYTERLLVDAWEYDNYVKKNIHFTPFADRALVDSYTRADNALYAAERGGAVPMERMDELRTRVHNETLRLKSHVIRKQISQGRR